ncbi:MAG: 4-hydroxy-tetrahydrodipicolinate reductase [Coxiella endosymbiont of Dermacentor silvarum]
MINVVINGVNGKMGRVVKESILTQSDFHLVAGTGRQDNLSKIIKATKADIVVDFTTRDAVFVNTEIIIDAGACPVIGTTGLTLEQIKILEKQCQEKKLGGIIAPNFSLGAVLMMKYSTDAARYFSNAEIIEMHHSDKVDAPSGTAIKTAQMMEEVRPASKEKEIYRNSARGVLKNNVPIHSVRLPGLFSHQFVIFSGNKEILTIQHNGIDRGCTISGIFIACRKVMDLDHLIYGLENLSLSDIPLK